MLLQSDFYLDGDAYGGVDVAYHENGRTSQVDYFFGEHGPGGSLGSELEGEDLHGMQRPLKHELWWDQGGYVLKVWDQGDYSYDGSGNITAIGGAPTKHYTYDGLNRLTGYYEGELPDLVQDYSYDNYGNLEALDDLDFGVDSNNNRLSTITLETDPDHPYTVGWNARGNLTSVPEVPGTGMRHKEFSYSKEDRLMKSKDIAGDLAWRFAYDAAGERVAAWQRASGALLDLTVFLRDEAGRVLSDWQLIPGVSFGPKRDYLYAGDRLAVQLDWSEGESPVRQYVAVDHLNSTRAIVDDNDNLEEIDYLPFGGFLTGGPQPSTNHLFTGHERDTALLASNLDYMHARYFSPNLGRFLSVDPVGGEVGSSQNWNRYTYALNNPVVFVDPDGLLSNPVTRERGVGGSTIVSSGGGVGQITQRGGVDIGGFHAYRSAGEHQGIDLHGAVGTPLVAIAAGRVTSAGSTKGKGGTLVVIDHGQGVESRLCHLDSVSVKPGQTVEEGQEVGTLGRSGNVSETQPADEDHVHMAIRVDGKPVDPKKFMNSAENQTKFAPEEANDESP